MSLGTIAFGGNGGLYSALVLATSIGPFLFTRFLIPEVLVALWLTLGFLCFLKSLEQDRPSRWVCWGFAVTCALNVLTKGLIGLVFPLGVVGFVSSAYRKSAPSSKAADCFKHAGVSCGRRSVACVGRVANADARETCAAFSGSTSSMNIFCDI